MMIRNNKYLILRRLLQFTLLLLFVSGARLGWTVLKGNYSTAEVLQTFHFSDPYFLLQILATGYFPHTEIIIGALIVTVFYFLVKGRLFCSWVCPLNIVTDWASWVRIKWHIRPLLAEQKVSRKVRFWILGLGLALSAIVEVAAFELINPISMLHRAVIFSSFSGLLVVLLVFLFDIFILGQGWCGHLCPVGAFYSLTGKYCLLKIFHNKENCTKCMKCKVVCPEVQVLDLIAIETASIKRSACTACGRCIDVCNDDALNFIITIK